MASLAPGNGWYPNRTYVPGPVYAPRRGYTNVYALPRARASATKDIAETSPEVLPAAPRYATGNARWPITALVVGVIAWVGLVGALFAAALGLGVPMLTTVAALAATHLLAALLALIIGVRVGRKLLASAQS